MKIKKSEFFKQISINIYNTLILIVPEYFEYFLFYCVAESMELEHLENIHLSEFCLMAYQPLWVI